MFNKHYYIVKNGNRMLCKYSGILKDKTIDNKLIYFPNDDKQFNSEPNVSYPSQ